MAKKELFLPTLKAFMGDWIYYITSMKLRDVSGRITSAAEVHDSKTLSELLQRSLDESKHVKQISQYLTRDKQRFFNALVVGIYGGAPRWHELTVPRRTKAEGKLLPDYLEGAFGVLELSGTEKIFAIDGQHRVYGIKESLKGKKDIGIEEVTVIFVPHEKSENGRQRTRRLFTRLNRFAKPVKKEEIISLDEDDVSAITTRTIIEDWPPLLDKISIKNSKGLAPSDRNHFTTISVIYDLCDILLKEGQNKEWNEHKKNRPGDTELKSAFNIVVGYLKRLATVFPEVQTTYEAASGSGFASPYRGRHGGHVLFRPIGLLIYTRAYRQLTSLGYAADVALEALGSIPSQLNEWPWKGIIWNDQAKRMLVNADNQRAAERLLLYKSIPDSRKLGFKLEKLKEEVANILEIPISDVTI